MGLVLRNVDYGCLSDDVGVNLDDDGMQTNYITLYMSAVYRTVNQR